MDKWDFDEYIDYMKDTIEYKLLKHNDDQMILACGYEGTGKSTITLATMCEVAKQRKKKPKKDMIFYLWDEYRDANLQAMVNGLKSGEFSDELIADVTGEYSLKLDEIKFKKDYGIEPGDILLFDEAGTQAYNREAMDRSNIDLTKLLIANRFLSLVHILNVPKPGSIDKYIREQRTRLMIWCDASYTRGKNHMWEQRIRNVYLYSRDSYMNMLATKGWWYYFASTGKMLKKFPPDTIISRPTNIFDYIPEDIWEYYMAKKYAFNIKQVVDMVEKEKPKRGNKEDMLGKLVKKGEDKKSWCERTKLSPSSYYSYRTPQ